MQRFVLFALIFLTVTARAATNQFDKWEPEIKKFEAADRAQMPPKHATLFVGSSSIRFWTNLAEAFPKTQTIRRGFGGSQTIDALHFADRIIINYEPKHVLVYEGDNDLAAGKSADEVVADFKALYEKIHTALPKTKVSFISIKPSPSRAKIADKAQAVNAAVKKMAKWNPHLQYIDVWNPMLGPDGKPMPDIFVADNLHMNPKGYEIWRRVIEKKL
jgi:lysophospholipase L1-like esterase